MSHRAYHSVKMKLPHNHNTEGGLKMTQLNFTLERDFFTGLFKKDREEAFGELMESLLNQFLIAESAEVLQADPYDRSEERTDYRNGFRDRELVCRIGKLTLRVPRHRNEPFHSCMLDSYQRSEQALITTMIEMVIQGVATRNIEKITEELCGRKFSKATISKLCKSLTEEVREFKERPLEKDYPFVMVDAMYIKVREDHRVRSKGLMIALGISSDGRKEILGFEVCDGETEKLWEKFLRRLKNRGLKGVDLITSDSHAGLVAAIKEVFQGVGWQRCQFHFMRNILDAAPKRYQTALSSELREVLHAETMEEARRRKKALMEEYEGCAAKAMSVLDDGFEDAMNVMGLPLKYRVTLRTSNLLERENQEIRRREKVIRIFPNEESAERLLGAVLMDHHDDWKALSRVFEMKEYYALKEQKGQMLRAA